MASMGLQDHSENEQPKNQRRGFMATVASIVNMIVTTRLMMATERIGGPRYRPHEMPYAETLIVDPIILQSHGKTICMQ